jgi:hypothetical protein
MKEFLYCDIYNSKTIGMTAIKNFVFNILASSFCLCYNTYKQEIEFNIQELGI